MYRSLFSVWFPSKWKFWNLSFKYLYLSKETHRLNDFYVCFVENKLVNYLNYGHREYNLEKATIYTIFIDIYIYLPDSKCNVKHWNPIPLEYCQLHYHRREYVTCEDLANDNACYVLPRTQTSHPVALILLPGREISFCFKLRSKRLTKWKDPRERACFPSSFFPL